MSAVIGLFPCKQAVDYQIKKLEEAGYSKDRIRVISHERSIYKLMGCDPKCIVTRYAAWGALYGILVYGIFAIVASWCECNIFHFSRGVAFGIVFVGVIFGAFIGAFIGSITGMAEFEKETHLYTQGIRNGNKVLILKVNDSESKRGKMALQNIGCTGIRSLDT